MGSLIVGVAILVCVGGIIWKRRGRWHTSSESPPPGGMPPEALAFEAFTHGNSCLVEGKFADAIAAFQRARELDPKRPHVADRLAEAERRQHAASPTPPAGASS